MSFLFSKPKVTEIGPAEARERAAKHRALIVDVREHNEWQSGHIPGAKHIPLGQLGAHSTELLAVPEIIFVCRSGNRSATAAKTLGSAKHTNVSSLAGGMQAWERAGLPVKR